jgi:pantothenate kinase
MEEPGRTFASIDTIIQAIRTRALERRRVLVGIAGPPGAGKSTLSSKLASRLGSDAAILPMDGYHLDNATLEDRGLLPRKGAPQTFDSEGFVELVRTLRQQDSVSYPVFDRGKDQTVPNGGRIDGKTRIVLVEGNYLLLQTPPWSELKPLFDVTLYLDVPREVLRTRLVNRWREHGLSLLQAEARADGNDMKNVETVHSCSGLADFFVKDDG